MKQGNAQDQQVEHPETHDTNPKNESSSIWSILKGAALALGQDKAMSFAAALAFYTALSFAPLVLLFVTIGGLLGDSTQNDLVALLGRELGAGAADTIEQVVNTAEAQQERGESTWWRWVVSIGMLIFSASTVFAQLQTSLNSIWNVKPKPGSGLFSWVRKRLLSIGMIFAILFILLASLLVSTVLEAVMPGEGVILRAGYMLVSLAVIAILFAFIYRYLPDVRIPWRHVWVGAGITAALFLIGRAGITLYLERAPVGESYGDSAASLIVLLVWVYYSSIIFFFGAEITQQWALRREGPMPPEEHASRG